jgi:hypothetical protein
MTKQKNSFFFLKIKGIKNYKYIHYMLFPDFIS